MSGSSGGGGGWGSFGDEGVTCEALVIHTQVSSPAPAVVAQLSKGDLLTVEVRQGAGVDIVELKYQGQLAGGLSSAQVVRLIECIRQGTNYRAEVQDISGGQVKVKVKAI